MQELDKQAMGRRVRQIRLNAGLRQWELARMLGTTQSAIHKYEHGVVPEPRRLVELARIGGTSLEWVLTGQHWENGSVEQQRLTPALLETACLFRQVSDDGRETVDEALRIVREAVEALRRASEEAAADPRAAVEALHSYGAETLTLLESAWRIQRAILRQVSRDAGRRLEKGPQIPGDSGETSASGGEGDAPPAVTPR
jgi:transcriptional regulator with XRE-family HTH domain